VVAYFFGATLYILVYSVISRWSGCY